MILNVNVLNDRKKNPRDVTGVRGVHVIVTVDIITREKT